MLRQCESSVRSAVPQRTPSERATHALGVKAVDGEDEGGESRKRGNHGKAETRGMGKTPPWRSRAGSPQAIAHPQFRCEPWAGNRQGPLPPTLRKIVSLKNCHPEPCCPFSEGFPMNAGELSQFAADVIEHHRREQPSASELAALQLTPFGPRGNNLAYRADGCGRIWFVKFCKNDANRIPDICEREVLVSLLGAVLRISVVRAWLIPASSLTLGDLPQEPLLIRDKRP